MERGWSKLRPFDARWTAGCAKEGARISGVDGVNMETPGLLLKREREARGLTLAELSRVTRISMTALEDIEKNAFDAFPAQVFVRGFLRNYARQLSIPADEIMASYENWMRQQAPVQPVDVVAPEEAVSVAHADRAESSRVKKEVKEGVGHSMRFAYVAILLIAAASLGLSFLFMGTGEAEEGDVDFLIQQNADVESPFLISNTSEGWIVE